VREIMSILAEVEPTPAYPGRHAEAAEWSREPFHVLITTVLSQRTKDANTHLASRQLFARFPDAESLADASQAEVEELIKPAGFYRSKAKNIIAISRRIIQRPDGKVPDNIEELLALPMVGRKTANCVLSYGFDIDAICVDTHVHRICNRIGLVQTPEADVTEAELRKVVPMDLWKEVNMRMVPFGQDVCLPRNPRCPACPIKKHCDYGRDL
jgi:endonuclease-3